MTDQTIPTEEQKQTEYGPATNPSYDKNLSPEQRLRDFMGGYHIEYNGGCGHKPFYLKYEGRPNERCDDSIKNEFVRFLNILVEDIRSSTLTEVEGEVNSERQDENNIAPPFRGITAYEGMYRRGFNNGLDAVLTRIKKMKEDHG